LSSEEKEDWGSALFYCAFTGVRMSNSTARGICSVLAYTSTRDLLLYYPRLAFKRGAVKRRYDYVTQTRQAVPDEGLVEIYECWEMIITEVAKEILLRHIALQYKLPLSGLMEDKLMALLTPTEQQTIQGLAAGATSSELTVYGQGILSEEEMASVLGTAAPAAEQKTIDEEDLEPGKRRAEGSLECDEDLSSDSEVSVEGSEDGDAESV
jgi:hypothetical protein